MNVIEEVAKIAADFRGSGDGQGPFYNPVTRTLFWSGGDSDFQEDTGGPDDNHMTTWPELSAKLLAVDGIDHVELEAECAPPEYEDYELGDSTRTDWIRIEYTPSYEVLCWQYWDLSRMYGKDDGILDEIFNVGTGPGQIQIVLPPDCQEHPSKTN